MIFCRHLLEFKEIRQFDDLDYIRVLLAFKLWKKIVYNYEKSSITSIWMNKVQPREKFLNNYNHYAFLPPKNHGTNAHEHLIQVHCNVGLMVMVCYIFFTYMRCSQLIFFFLQRFFRFIEKQKKNNPPPTYESNFEKKDIFDNFYQKNFDGNTFASKVSLQHVIQYLLEVTRDCPSYHGKGANRWCRRGAVRIKSHAPLLGRGITFGIIPNSVELGRARDLPSHQFSTLPFP